ncbi:hypothetical protein Pmar_PMAR021461 [Perkinsus marinus ATCC 50983]|uniref:Uncharacterized protein n=1 Tax=Perkinsus marinus (strain ATCC 50983 / TXsc) TaxID=423536 RepID=C5KA49_PERM5|nr:hypothetical protein Pmar_PMAR021461 [Perkinsus marinus ATCC 50983]EER18645.1 hypothetical protein Pmar_PMAR021461 [Perkinsus marinus ATCC 50983]|eukprot:XP_002786849.1 hypothetical protein Pmar_PMAR021461 [Perkinsus marinus ATCC 50983]
MLRTNQRSVYDNVELQEKKQKYRNYHKQLVHYHQELRSWIIPNVLYKKLKT